MSKNRNEKKLSKYEREQGNREANKPKRRKLSFSLSQQIDGLPGQTFKEWEEEGLSAKLMIRLKFLGQFTCQEAIQKAYIKEYTKVGYPDHSKFPQPKHITADVWAVMHVTDSSKAVVAGYLDKDSDVFYIVFLDKDHLFWPMANK